MLLALTNETEDRDIPSPSIYGFACSVLFLLAAKPTLADCKDDWICVDAVTRGDQIELVARNLREFPITYTLKVQTRYMQVDGPMSATRTLTPKHSERVMMLSPADEQHTGHYDFSYKWTVGDQNAIHDDETVYALPYASGKAYRVLQGYGSRFSHKGLEEFAVDFDMPAEPVTVRNDDEIQTIVPGYDCPW